jgi:hypothetical protein
MKIKDLIDKVVEENIQLWDMPDFTLIVRDASGKNLTVDNIKINKDNKTIRIVVK